MVINGNQWYLTKLVGEVFLWHNYSCYVNDISRSKLVRYLCGTSIPATSMISHEICWWDISVVKVIQAIQLIQVIKVGLTHLWPDFWVILDQSSSDPARHRQTLQARRQLFFTCRPAYSANIWSSCILEYGPWLKRWKKWTRGLKILVYNTEYFLHSLNQSTPLVKTIDQTPKLFQMGNSSGQMSFARVESRVCCVRSLIWGKILPQRAFCARG